MPVMKAALRTLVVLTSFATLTACSTFKTAVPEGYSGPTATLKDSDDTYSASKADMFYALTVNGNDVDNARFSTRRANEGRGMMMAVQKFERKIPATPQAINIVGRTIFAAPIQAMTSTVYQVKGVVNFTPEANKVYVIRGKLDETYSAVWIEEESTKAVVGEKIEVNGSARLGFFEK